MDWCREYLLSHEGIRLFEHYIMIEIENQIRKFGMTLFGVSEFYLPNPGFNRQVGLLKGTEIRWYERPEIPELYSDRRFRNALLYDINGLRPDMLAVVAVADGEIKAMAGASMDSGMFWQIGIDVLPDYRNNGLGAYLVSALTDAILERGFIPYYGTWSANIASRNVAASSGYFPAWVETHAMIRDKKVTGGV
jgi:GNAT superfamily N-acetyltransferase